MDFRRQKREHTPIIIDRTPVEQVSSFKFLGVTITEDLTWSAHTDAVLKKAQQRLFFLRRLRKFGMSPHILHSLYTCTVESILTEQHQQQSQRVVQTARHTVGGELPSLQDIYTRRCMRKAQRIISDSSHPSHGLFSLLPSGRRLHSIRTRTSRLRDSLFPQTIRLLNTRNWHSHSTPLCPYHSRCTFNSNTIFFLCFSLPTGLKCSMHCTLTQQYSANIYIPTTTSTTIMWSIFVLCFLHCLEHAPKLFTHHGTRAVGDVTIKVIWFEEMTLCYNVK